MIKYWYWHVSDAWFNVIPIKILFSQLDVGMKFSNQWKTCFLFIYLFRSEVFFFIFYFSFSFFSLLSFLRCQWVDWWRTVFFSVFIFSDWECCIFIRSLSNTSFDRSHSFCFFSFLRCQYKSFACVFNSNDDNNHFSWITSNVSINEKTYRDYRACLWLPRMLNWENKCQI